MGSPADLPDCFTRYVGMVDGLGRHPHCGAHRTYRATCARCQTAQNVYSRSYHLQHRSSRATRPKPAPAHAVVGTLCRCDECWSRMRQIAEGVS